jgi:hypothetical protein
LAEPRISARREPPGSEPWRSDGAPPVGEPVERLKDTTALGLIWHGDDSEELIVDDWLVDDMLTEQTLSKHEQATTRQTVR